MKTISAGLQTHLDGEVTRLATCWRITRLDGTEFFFTDHDQDVSFGGNSYLSAAGYDRTAIENDSSLSVDNLDVAGFLNSSALDETELRAGLFDKADVEVFLVNWADPDGLGNLKLRKGRFGEVKTTERGQFVVELRGLTQELSQSVVEVTTPECRADLGDSRCTVPLNPDLRLNSTDYAEGDFVRVATDGGAAGQAQYENRIYECTRGGTSDSSAPTFDTTPGNTTNDGEAFATGVLTLTGNFSDGDQVLIGSKTYTMQASLTDVDGNVQIGATPSDSIDNLAAAVDLGAGAGTLYAASMTAHPDVDAAAGVGDTLDVTAEVFGDAGNNIATTETSTNASWGAATLQGGIDGVEWTAREAWTRHAVIGNVTDNRVFTIAVTESRAVDDWFNYGVVTFEDGDLAGISMEIRDWDQGTNTVTLFLPAVFSPAMGGLIRLYPGCDKTRSSCKAFAIDGSLDYPSGRGNIWNYRGEPFIPGQDEAMKYPDAQ